MTTTAVGSLVSSTTAGATTLDVSPATVGDVLLLVVKVKSGSITVSSVAGGGATWAKAVGWTDATTDSGLRLEVWVGTITATGAAPITITFSASTAGLSTDIACQEFDSGLGTATTWSVDTSGHNSGSGTAISLPSLTPAAAGEIYFGYGWSGGSSSAGSTTGYTYDQLSNGNYVIFDPSCTSAAQAPTFSQTSNSWSTIGALVAPVPAATPTANAPGKLTKAMWDALTASHPLKVMLIDDTWVYGQDTAEYVSEVTGEVTGTGYTAGGATVTGVAAAYNAASHALTVTAGNVTWDATGGSLAAARAVWYIDTGTPSTSPIVAVWDFDGTVTATAEQFELIPGAGDLLTVTVST